MRVFAAIGDIARIFSPAFLLPLVVAAILEPADTSVFGLFLVPKNSVVFLGAGAATLLFSVSMKRITRSVEDDDLLDREAYLTVALGWLVLTAFALLPFVWHGMGPVDAWFETMSGLTTTGASIITDLESTPASIHMWRAQLQFIGGMGIIVLSMALLARLSHGGMQLLAAEAPGPTVTKMRPKLAQVAKTLWTVYAAISAVLLVLLLVILLARGWPFLDAVYDSLLHTFTTMATGGFSNHGSSIAFFDSWLIELVILVFMLVAGTNFTLHYYAAHGQWKQLWKDSEWRFFMLSFLISSLVITGLVWRAAGFGLGALADALRGATFTTGSILTSTGFATVDYDAWPAATKVLLLVMMVTGATAGSTSGGMKHVRILLLFKILGRQMRLLLHPRAVIPVRLGGRIIKEETLTATVAFFFAFVSILMLGALVLLATDPYFGGSIFDATGAAATAMGNTGPAFGVAGPTDTYAALLPHSKVLLSLLMWTGRLEVFAVLMLLSPAAWKKY